MKAISADFRSTLKQEIPLWVENGIVTENAAQQLAERYQLKDIQKESSRLLVAIIFTVGGLLLGGGVISFVAANWEEIPIAAKVALLLIALLGFHLTGYWLWHQKGWARLGHALVFTGSLVFGANIGLMAQIFHVSGEWYGAFGAWAFGTLIMAYAARSWITGLLSLLTSVIWFQGYTWGHQNFLVAIFPLLLAAVFIYLSWQLSSRVLYTATFIGFTFSICALGAIRHQTHKGVLLALLAGGFLSWSVGEFQRTSNRRPEYGNLIAGMGILLLGGCAYIWSFHDWWRLREWIGETTQAKLFSVWLIPTIITFAVAVALAVIVVRGTEIDSSRRMPMLGIFVAVALLALCAVSNLTSPANYALPTVLVNIAALMIAAVVISIGIMDERRIAFWAGALFLVLIVISRFLEYDTSLLVKSAAFTICGVTMIAAGVAYEKYLHRREARI